METFVFQTRRPIAKSHSLKLEKPGLFSFCVSLGNLLVKILAMLKHNKKYDLPVGGLLDVSSKLVVKLKSIGVFSLDYYRQRKLFQCMHAMWIPGAEALNCIETGELEA